MPKTEFYWRIPRIPDPKDDLLVNFEFSNDYYYCIRAPLVSELGEWLPQGFLSSKTLSNYACAVPEHWSEQMISTYGLNNRDLWDISKSKTEADARQKMLNYLIAEGIVTTL